MRRIQPLFCSKKMEDSSGIFAFFGCAHFFWERAPGSARAPFSNPLSGLMNPVGNLAEMRNHEGGYRPGPGDKARM